MRLMVYGKDLPFEEMIEWNWGQRDVVGMLDVIKGLTVAVAEIGHSWMVGLWQQTM